MNREIKFRGLREDGKGVVYGYLVIDPQKRCRIYYQPFGASSSNTYQFVKKESVGQYIASNGKQDFYVGDIVVNPKGRKHTVVIWDNLPCLQYTDKSKVYFAPMTNGFLNNKTVIGNIHEKGGSK